MVFVALIISLLTGGIAQQSSAIVIGSVKFLGVPSAVASSKNLDGCKACAYCSAGLIGGAALIAAGVYGACFAGVSTTKALCCACCQDACCQCCCTPHSCSIAAKSDNYQGIKDQSHIDYATSPQAEEDLDNALQQIHLLRKEDKETVLNGLLHVLDAWSEKEADLTTGSVKTLKKGNDIALDVKLTKRNVENILSQSRYDYTFEETTKIVSLLCN